nr:cupin domain-containing protein [Pseudoduganella armeniaca]
MLCASSLAPAQTGSTPPPLKRTEIARADVSVPNREAIVAHVEIAPGATAARHTHPGDEISYFLGGEGELLVDGQPPRRLKAGEAFIIPAGVVHAARNPGSEPARLVGVYVVEKGQPLATPAK